MILGDSLDTSRRMERHVRQRFDVVGLIGVDRPVSTVESVDTFWKYVNYTVLPKVYGEDPSRWFVPGVIIPKMLPLDGDSRMIGVMRLRLVRVNSNVNCGVRSEYQDHWER